jgi:NitT/TauT family transport system permease protein
MGKRNWQEMAIGLVVPVLAIGVWQWVAVNHWVNEQVLPAPLDVARKWLAYLLPLQEFKDYTGGGRWAWAFSGELVLDSLSSLYRVLVGFAIGAGLALPLGLAMGASRAMYAWFNPLVQLLRPIPPIAYIPLSILWFGLGNPPALFLISLGAFFPVLMNTIAGVRQVDGIYLRAARNLGASGSTLFLRVILPAAVPYILTGMRIGVGTAFIVVIVAEMIAVNNGLGFRILEAREYFWSDKIIAGMITIGLLGLAIDAAMNTLNNYLLRWHRGLEH